jgi:hypothetical protein
MKSTSLLAREWACLALGLVEVASDQLVRPVTGKSDVKAAHNDFVND